MMLKSYSLIPRVLQTIAWLPTRLLLNFFCSFKVRGKQNLNGLTQAIFAVNHASELDPIILTGALSPFGSFAPMFYVTAPTNEFSDRRFGWRRHIYKSWFFKSWGAYSFLRGLQDYSQSLQVYLDILQDGGSICIFPEGGVTKNGNLREGRGGVGFLSHRTGIPIVPVAIEGSYRTTPKNFLSRSKRFSATFGSPIHPQELFTPDSIFPDAYKDAAQRSMTEIGKLMSVNQ